MNSTKKGLSGQIRRVSEILKANSAEEIKSYKEKFQTVAEFYDRFLDNLIVLGIDTKEAKEIASKLFGATKVKFAAIDGTEYSREIADLVLFFGGAYGVLGEIEFNLDKPKVTFSHNIFESGRGISACVPIYVNEVQDLDQLVFGEGEEEQYTISLEDTEVINNTLISKWMMNFAEYFLAYKMVVDEKVKILLLDRNLSGDQAGFISQLSKRHLWPKMALYNLDVNGVKLNENHFDILRYWIVNWDLDVLASRGDFLKFKVIFLLDKELEPLTLDKICDLLDITESERIGRVENCLKSWMDKGVIKEDGKKYSLNSEYRNMWEKIKELVNEIGDNVFLGEDYTKVMKVNKNGKDYWLTTLDLSFLTLFTQYMLLEECWKKKVLLIGLTKDTSARDFKNHLIPIFQNLKLVKSKLTAEDIANLPNTDRMFFQSVSLLNYDKFSPPWSSIEYDASFATIAPEKGNYIKGAIRNKISPERVFLKSYIQLVQAKRDPKIRSNVLAMNRLTYPEFDFKKDSILNLVNKYTATIEEPVDVITYRNNSIKNPIQNLVNVILVSMVDSSILEVFGHNKPLFVADKLAKWHVAIFIKIIESLKLWIKDNPSLRDFIFYMSTFRERREEIEKFRRRG